jgi:hypothetical protein
MQIEKARFLTWWKSLETKRVEYPLPHNLVCKLSSLLQCHGTYDRVESVGKDDIDTG